MPSWGVHLSIAKQINEKLNLPKDEFLFGNILPDILNGYYIKDISNIKTYNETHFIPIDSDEYLNCPKVPKYELFLDKYITQIYDPIIMGYYIHLLTDFYFNKEIINNYITLGVDINFNKLKQFDFRMLETYLLKRTSVEIPQNNDNLYISSNKLLGLTYEDIDKTIDYLNNKYIKDRKEVSEEYKLIPFNELLKIYKECIEFINLKIEDLKNKI